MTLAQNIAGLTPTDYATRLLKAWGVPVNPTNLDTLTRWMSAESSGYNPNSPGGKYNPLNIVAQGRGGLTTGQVSPVDGSVGQGGSQGDIADFPDAQSGITATARFFSPRGGTKEQILNGFRASNQAATVAAISRFYGSWGSGFSLGGTPPNSAVSGGGGAGGTASSAGGTGTATATDASSTDSECVWKLTMPGPIPNFCLTHSQGRALLGVATMATGFALLVVAAGIASRRQIISGIGGIAGAAKLV